MPAQAARIDNPSARQRDENREGSAIGGALCSRLLGGAGLCSLLLGSDSWPEETWEQELLGYAPPDLRKLPAEDARILEWRREHRHRGHADGLPPGEH
jgi:hypothetical protein